MTEKPTKQTQIIIYVTIISIIYNLLFLTLFLLIFMQYPKNIVFYTMGFLLFYILVAQPLKDYIITHFLFRVAFPNVEKTLTGTQRDHHLGSKRDIQNFLTWFIKSNNLQHVYLILEGSDQNCFFLTRDREFQAVNPGRYLNKSLLQYIKMRPESRNIESYPIHLQNFLREQEWQTIMPVLFRSTVIGYLAFPVKLEKKMVSYLDKYIQRIGLIFANESMAESALNTKVFQKEYSLAKRLEKLLINISNESFGNYMVYSPLLNKEKKPFPVLIDKTISGKKNEKHYYLICRISEKTHRSTIMLLFAVQGFFFIASRKTNSLSGLVKKLNTLLFFSETESAIDGVLIEHTTRFGWKISPFGKNVSLEYDGKTKLVNNTPLGKSEKSTYPVLTLKDFEFAVVKMKQHQIFQMEQH